MARLIFALLILVVTSLGFDEARARKAYTYDTSGFCPDLKHVRDVSHCAKLGHGGQNPAPQLGIKRNKKSQ